MIALEKKSQNTRMPRNTLRTYAEIIKSTTTSKDSEIEIQRRKQRESLLQERAKIQDHFNYKRHEHRHTTVNYQHVS